MSMINHLSLLSVLMLLFTFNAYASDEEQKEKVVTAKWAFISGDGAVVNHYLSDQEYTGDLLGLSMSFGSFYRKYDKVSWDFDLTYILSPYTDIIDGIGLSNPAGTSYYALHNLRAEYGSYYNWNPAKNLSIKAGASFDMLFGLTTGKPHHINNAFDLDFQTQFKAAAGIRYGWNFKKFGLFLQADVAVPFIGAALGGGPYQGSFDSIGSSEILPGTISTFHFTSFHNLTGFNTEFEIDFVFKKTTLFLTLEYNNRWWNFHGIQNYRKYNLSRIGIMVDLVSRGRHNSENKYF